ncbi:early endosome antigen 1-like isoform X4 [Zophobas morio]|uniref:early endosome antigen 1-like isoform X4 n=1 Tax=Zophobas morio TaxID=2755281 RepID=UPI003082FD59
MYERKIVGKRKSFTNFSIYSSFSSYTLRYRNCNTSENKKQRTHVGNIIKHISTGINSFILFANFYFNHCSKYIFIANIYHVYATFAYWNLCYFITDHRMNCRQCGNVGTDAGDHNVYQIQQILKNDMIDETESSESSNSVEATNQNATRTKKSLFATLVKKKHTGRPKMKITKKIETCSTIRFGTESASSDQELAHYQLSTEMTHNPVCKRPHPKKKKRGFLKKIMRSSNSSCMKVAPKNKLGDSSSNESKALVMNKLVPTAYMPKYNLKLITGMHELQDILQNLHLSEQYVVCLLKKYVVNEDMRKELLGATFEFFALQYDSKCQVNVLGDKMWFQQLEIFKAQDYSLTKRLNYLVKTNRALELQLEDLNRQCEKLAFRKNAYPKRFLHMKSFGKVYAKQLIDNNKKLQKKLVALTGVISDFEDELGKLQHQKDVLEDERRNLQSQIYHLHREVEKMEHYNHFEKTKLETQTNYQGELINEAVSTVQLILQDLQDFKYQLTEYTIAVVWPELQLQSENPCLTDLIYQLRSRVGQILLAMITAYRNLTIVAQDVNKLRSTNARLQENLQKSANELDSLSKKLGGSESIDVSVLEMQCRKFKQELVNLNAKLESMSEQNINLREEKKTISDNQVSMNDLQMQNRSLVGQIDELVRITSQSGTENLTKEFQSSQEKLDYLKLRCNQIIDDQKHLSERFHNLDYENQNLHQIQQAYQQDLTTLQEGLKVLTTENEAIKKQLAVEHQTITTLQNERLKYLEEKNILKTVFHHLKCEVSRIQQLEGAVADMSKETNRLSLVAEFNKQIGEQLKTEVETKEMTILELRQSLEKLSHIQIDSDKEKLTLCAQLSEVVSVKDKLSDCLEVELKKNMRLDESKKKLETNTRSQLKIFEEMQKNERTALRELLKDFKSLIKQRDCLVLMQEESKKKYKELEKHYHELRKQHDETLDEVNKKEEEVRRMVDRIQFQEEQSQQQEENHSNHVAKCEKTIKKLGKLLGQMRNEKGEAESSVMYLKNNLQKLQSELDDARKQLSVTENKMISKSTEAATLNSELTASNNELQMLRQEHGKLTLELEYVNKMKEQQLTEYKEAISGFTTKESIYIESQSTIRNKEREINELSRGIVEKEGEIKRLEQECGHLQKQIDDQTKILIGYENHLVALEDVQNSKLKTERELTNARMDFTSVTQELADALKENETLRNELKNLIKRGEQERTFFKRQTNEIIFGYSEQKANIEEEIDSISGQLRSVTENLRSEKVRFDELATAYDDLKLKHVQLKEKFSLEGAAHQEVVRKLEEVQSYVNVVTTERDNLQQQVHVLLLEINNEKDVVHRLTNDNRTIELILEQGKQQYACLLDKNAALGEELSQMKQEMQAICNTKDSSKGEAFKAAAQLELKKEELKSAKETIDCLKNELGDSQRTLFELKEEYFKLQQQVTSLEFKNCELTLQLHETQGKLETERNLFRELKEAKPGNDKMSTVVPSGDADLYFP